MDCLFRRRILSYVTSASYDGLVNDGHVIGHVPVDGLLGGGVGVSVRRLLEILRVRGLQAPHRITLLQRERRNCDVNSYVAKTSQSAYLPHTVARVRVSTNTWDKMALKSDIGCPLLNQWTSLSIPGWGQGSDQGWSWSRGGPYANR